MRKLTVVLIFLANSIYSQSELPMGVQRYEGLSREKVFVSHNTSLLFAGEYLYYTVFCLDDKTKQPSEISSLAYVQLVSEDGEIIFEHKVRLKKSVGQGEFFVPTSVTSGNYKLIGFTKWMRNGATEFFFQDDISIINPYLGDQHAILAAETKNGVQGSDAKIDLETDNRFVVETDKKQYGKRAKATIEIKNFRGPSGHGRYSISVRRKSDFPSEMKPLNPIQFIADYAKKTRGSLPKYYGINFLPEESGERLIGRVQANDSATEVRNKLVAVSLPGDDFQLKVAATDEKGLFFIDIDKTYEKPIAVVQMLNGNNDDFTIELEKEKPLVLENLNFRKFQIDSTLKSAILTRSLHNQIENGFYEVRPDTLKVGGNNDPYWGSEVEEYDLDEFKRFPTLIETMVEIIPYASIRKEDRDNFVFNVRLFEHYEGPQRNALVFIDGMLITSHKRIVDFDSRQIKKIKVFREEFALAGKYYRGMINIETLNKDYFELVEGDMNKIVLKSPVLSKHYFNQNYGDDRMADNRIPDYRHQLLWMPNIEFEGRKQRVDFFTSDVSGEYEITLQGFSLFGRPVHVQETIVVE